MRVRFGPFVFDSAARELADGARALRLSPKAFDLLRVLIDERHRVVSKAELQDAVWPGVFVEEANVGNAVAEIRKVLGDDPKSPKYVRTISRHGYRFCAEVTELEASRASGGQRHVRWWLTWNGTMLPLTEGENSIGRHPESTVRIDAKSVSRNHARILIAADRAAVEDLGSMNGTYVDGKRITSRHALADGATVTFGSEKAVYREWVDESAAPTDPI